MRRIIFILGFALLFLVTNAQTPYYYYYKGEKQYLHVSPDKVLVRFTENAETSTVKAAIAKNTSLQVAGISNADKKGQHLVCFAGTDTAQTMQLTKQWKNKDSILYATPVFIDRKGKEMAALTNQVIIRLKQEADSLVLQESLANYAVYSLRQDEFDRKIYLFNVDYTSQKNAMEVANELYETGLFEFVEPDLLLFIEYHGEAIPNDTYFPYQWNLKNTGQYGGIPGIDIKATYAWDITTGDSSIKIAILDDFVDPVHPDLIDNTLPGDLTGSGPHGSVCAGICASRGNNARGIAGVTHHCRILYYDVGSYYQMSSVVNAINRAVQAGARVISMSFSVGRDIPLNAFEQGMSDAVDSGCILLASAGNNDSTGIKYPAAYDKVMAVGAVNHWGERKSQTSSDTEDWGSNYGSDLDIMAPGVLIPATDVQGDGGYNPNDAVHTRMNNGTLLSDEDEYADRDYTRWFAGTSSACPHVAGIAALVLSVNPNLTSTEVREIIESTAQKVRPDLYTYDYQDTNLHPNGSWNNEMGYGLVNAYAAVLKAMGCTDPAKLVVRDILSDEGDEPTMGADSLLWNSPDIWVRRSNDRGLTHQEPCPNTTNYIHIRVRNYGCQSSTGNEKVSLYWAKTDNSMPWSQHWQGNTYPNGKLKGDNIGTFTINYGMPLTAGEEYTVVVPWHFPNPADYAAINQPEMFTLLAKIATNTDTLNETTDIIGNVRNNNKIAMKNVSVTNRVDLIIKDSPNDKGDEPHVNFHVETQSKQDIWVRHQPDNGLTHQNPKPDSINYIYVNISNIGCSPSMGNDSLKLYWAKAGTDMSFPYNWEGNNISGTNLLSGNMIGTHPIPAIAAGGEETIIGIPWQAPNPSTYFGLINETWNFYLLARIESSNDIMTYPETTDIRNNVLNNNNIAWKRIDVTDKIDLMICDTENDLGIEPNSDSLSNLWHSPDIWVRHYADGLTEPQDPKPNTLNYVYVRVKNTGNTLSRGNEQLELYWAKGNSNLSWSSDWEKVIVNIYDHMQIIDSIVSYNISTILPNGEAIIEIPWNVPNPLDFCNTDNEDCSFLLLAMIKTENDTLFYPLTENSYENVKNNNNIAGKKVYANDCVVKIDLMLRDDNNDTGIEPDYTNTPGNSPDIWIRHTQDNGSTHQNPLPNDTNYIYVRIKNKGNAPSQENDILKLYWTKAKEASQWDSSWTGGHFPQNGQLMGNLIDSIAIPVIPCGEDTIMVIPWHTPNPNNYCGIKDVSSPLNFHILARIESELDTIKYSETTDITNNIKRNNNIAMKNVNFLRRNLMIQDTESDTGEEPNTAAIIWESPDIWVYNYGMIGQTPVANKANKVYVQIKNIGCLASTGNEVLKLYWAKTGTSLAWDSCWSGNYFPQNGPLMGNFIGSATIPSLSANTETTLQINWTNTPDPDDYYGISNNPSQFSLLARIEENGSSLTSEMEDLESNVRNNRNIAWKNVTVVNHLDLMIRDNPTDTGRESNPYTGNLWDSPDICVRHQLSDSFDTVNQHLLRDKKMVYLNVQVKNKGNRPLFLGEASIYFYWTKAGLPNNDDWYNTWDLIAIEPILYHLEPGEECIVNCILGSHNYPQEYEGGDDNIEEPWHYYVLAVIQSNEDPFNYQGYVLDDIKYNNNIAGKSVAIGTHVDLMIKDTEDDTGIEPNPTPSDVMWESPDIWIRNAPDMLTEHQNPIGKCTNYVHIRIKNRGDVPSWGNESLYLYWSKAGTELEWPKQWDGSESFVKNDGSTVVAGKPIGGIRIPRIKPGKDTIVIVPWYVPDTADYYGINNIEEPWHYCLLARIVAENDPMKTAEIASINQYVRGNNNVAWKNITVLEISDGEGAAIGIRRGSALPFCLRFLSGTASETLINEAEVSVKLDDVLYRAWERGGLLSEGLQVKDNRTLLIKSANARLCNLILNPDELGILSARFNFLTRKITNQVNYTFHVMQTDYQTDALIGGEVYSIIKSPRTPFYAHAGGEIYACAGQPIQLAAIPVGEPATYNWYDPNGNLVHTGMSFTTPAVIGRKYKLEVIASADGYKDYAEVEIKGDMSNLIIPDSKYDMGGMESSNSLHFLYELEHRQNWLWNSPNIWVRNYPDGGTGHQNPHSSYGTNYIYVRIRNIGSTPSCENQQISFYWSKMATSLAWRYPQNPNPYYPYYDPRPMSYNIIERIPIPSIPAYGEIVLEVPWRMVPDLPNLTIFPAPSGQFWDYSILAKIEGGTPMDYPEANNTYLNVAYSNKIALKNVSVFLADYHTGTVIGIGGDPNSRSRNHSNLHFVAGVESGMIYNEADIIVEMDPVLYQAWQREGCQGNNIENLGNRRIKILDRNASIKYLLFEPHELGLLHLQFRFFRFHQPPFTFHVVQTDPQSAKIIGGAAFEIRDPFAYHSFHTNAREDIYADKGEIINLSAEQMSEPALYNWYDQSGNLVHEGRDFTTTVSKTEKYNLEIISLTNGNKDYSEVNVLLNPSKIEKISPNPATHEIKVDYKLNEVENASIVVSNYYFTGSHDSYILDIHSQSQTFSVANYMPGLYTVTLICDGVVADMKTFIKR